VIRSDGTRELELVATCTRPGDPGRQVFGERFRHEAVSEEGEMLGDVVEVSVVVRNLEEAVERFTRRFGLTVHRRGESKRFGFKNAILPTGIGHIELMEPTDPTKPVARFLEKNGEGVYLVGFECGDIPGAVATLRADGARVDSPDETIAWVHPREAHGLFVELRHRERYE
jgi:methylmalonyl-CoA/ethylmalonyl-CoA epimerase